MSGLPEPARRWQLVVAPDRYHPHASAVAGLPRGW
jgi:hypothetical protein